MLMSVKEARRFNVSPHPTSLLYIMPPPKRKIKQVSSAEFHPSG